MSGPLSGVTVVELCSALSGPFATKLLGDLGADVVKVEDVDGGAPDRTRKLPWDRHGNPEFTWRFLNYNTSKRSLALDLTAEEGRSAFVRLVDDADVLVENMRPGVMEALGLPPGDLHDRNPELIYCSIKGFGEGGPYADLPAVDTTVQAVSGFATQVDVESAGPMSSGVLVVDMATGAYAAFSVAAALFERHGSDEGQRVDVSMLDAAVSLLGHQLAEYTAGRHHGFDPDYGPNFAPNGYFETADGTLGLLILDDHWSGFCEAMGVPEWADPGHEYATNERRLERREGLRADLTALLEERTVEEWMDYFADRDEVILAGPVREVDEMVSDPQVRAQAAVQRRDHHVMGEYYTPGVVPRFSRTAGSLSDAPALGEDTATVLSELGYDEATIDRLIDEGTAR